MGDNYGVAPAGLLAQLANRALSGLQQNGFPEAATQTRHQPLWPHTGDSDPVPGAVAAYRQFQDVGSNAGGAGLVGGKGGKEGGSRELLQELKARRAESRSSSRSGSDSESDSGNASEPARKQARITSFGESGPAEPLPAAFDMLEFQSDSFPACESAAPQNQAPQLVPPSDRLCIFYQQGMCKKGAECNFSHGETARAWRDQTAATAAGVPSTQPANSVLKFSTVNLDAGHVSRNISVPEKQVKLLMTSSTKNLLMEVTGVFDVVYNPARCKVSVTGTEAQVLKAVKHIQRVTTHCLWGMSVAKIQGLLRPPQDCSSSRCRFSPMTPLLKAFKATLTAGSPNLTIGADPKNHLTVKAPNISRNHAQLEFVPSRGVVYVTDTSTNGTFLNGKRLPAKGSAKVVLWHGDELLFSDPAAGAEFGYMVNLEMS